MALSIIKTCPNLSTLFDAADVGTVVAFLRTKPFELMKWVGTFLEETGDLEDIDAAKARLGKERKDQLKPLESEAARIVTMAANRGQFALEGLAQTKLGQERLTVFTAQKDELTRSLWAYVNELMLFEAAENSLHMRLYRRYDRHYQTFLSEPSVGIDPDAENDLIKGLLAKLEADLRRGKGCSIDRFEIPEDGEEPAAVMYLICHPSPATSVRDLDDDGNLSKIYVRPPGEAVIFYTPSTGRVHVRAGSRALRHKIADNFIKGVLLQEPSEQPVDFQAYDISQFHSKFDLERPIYDEVEIKTAAILRVEVSVEDLASRLSISTSADSSLRSLIEKQSGLGLILERAIATRLLEIAVRYRLKSRDDTRTLTFTLTDRNTCSLFSVDDPYERILGHRLLRHWGIMREGRAPAESDGMKALPALLELWDIGRETVSGGWLYDRHIDPGLLMDIGFLVPIGAEGDEESQDADLIDDENQLGPIVGEVVSRPGGFSLRSSIGHETPAGPAERYRLYRIRAGWVAKYLHSITAKLLANKEPVVLNANLVALGTLLIDGREVPIYLARGLHDEKTRAEVDSQLRALKGGGVSIVLQAGRAFGDSLAGNILTRLSEHLTGELPNIDLDVESIQAAYVRSHFLAVGGEVVQLVPIGDATATLYVPQKGSIDIPGEQRVKVIQKLVDAHNAGQPLVSSDDLREGIEDQSLSNIFGQPLYKKLKADFIRSPKRPLWEIAI